MVPFTGSGEDLESTMLSVGHGKVGKMKMRASRDVGKLRHKIIVASCIGHFVAIESSHCVTVVLVLKCKCTLAHCYIESS